MAHKRDSVALNYERWHQDKRDAFAVVVVVARVVLDTLSMLNNLYKVPDLFKTSNMFQRVMGLFLLKCLSTNA